MLWQDPIEAENEERRESIVVEGRSRRTGSLFISQLIPARLSH